MADCLIELSTRMGHREIVVVFSDFFTDLDALEAAVHRLRYNRHEVVLFQVLHHDELSFEFDTLTKFIGLEIVEELLVQPEDLRRGYLNALEEYNRQLEEIAERNATDRLLIDTSRPLGETFADYLNRRDRQHRRI
jgi:hypothetical protein